MPREESFSWKMGEMVTWLEVSKRATMRIINGMNLSLLGRHGDQGARSISIHPSIHHLPTRSPSLNHPYIQQIFSEYKCPSSSPPAPLGNHTVSMCSCVCCILQDSRGHSTHHCLLGVVRCVTHVAKAWQRQANGELCTVFNDRRLWERAEVFNHIIGHGQDSDQ